MNYQRPIFEELRAINVIVNVHYIPVHTQPYYEKLGFKAGAFPEAEQYYRETLTIPLYYRLTDEEQEYVVEVLRNIIK